jgi:hypothetical protein
MLRFSVYELDRIYLCACVTFLYTSSSWRVKILMINTEITNLRADYSQSYRSNLSSVKQRFAHGTHTNEENS